MPTPSTRETALRTASVSSYWNILLPAVSFTLPFLLPHPQWLTGTLVNCFLLLSASFLSPRALLGVVILPNIGAILNGALFGVFTPFLLFFAPFIWAGNWIYATLFGLLRDRLGSFLALVASAAAKSALLFVVAYVYVSLGLVPAIFLTVMGVFQLGTALAGGLLALGILRLQKA